MMNLEEFISKCETKAQEDGREHYVYKAVCNLSEGDVTQIFNYVSGILEESFDEINANDNLSKLKKINDLLFEANLYPEVLRQKGDISDYRPIVVGCLTTIGEQTQYDYHKDDLKEGEQEFLFYDVPEGMEFVGILAGSSARTAFFRFVEMPKVKGEKVPKAGKPGLNAGLYAKGVHIAGKD